MVFWGEEDGPSNWSLYLDMEGYRRDLYVCTMAGLQYKGLNIRCSCEVCDS